MKTCLFALCAILGFAGMSECSGVTVGDSRLKITLSGTGPQLCETRFIVDGRAMDGLTALPAALEIDGTKVAIGGESSQDQEEKSQLLTSYTDRYEQQDLVLEISYHVTGPGRITKTLSITPKRDLTLERVSLWSATSSQAPKVASTELSDMAAFYRQGKRGLFVSLDFPYSKVTFENGRTSVGYPPHIPLKAGKTYMGHSLTMGAVTLTGRERYGFDEGEVEAMDCYVQERFKPRFERPMFVSCSINNRYTQPQGDIIFYTMKDHPTLNCNTDLLKRELSVIPELGMEYYQVFPGVFDWGQNDPSHTDVKRIVEYAKDKGVRIGDYSGTSSLFCPHYNFHRNSLDKPGWQVMGADGKAQGIYCFGDSDFIDFYIDKVVPNARKFGFEMHCLDFLALSPCYSKDHGHPAGPESLYRQVEGLTRLLEAINSVSPQMMTWSNSGNWSGLLPKIAWYNPNLYLTDPFIASPWQGLNMTRLLDDARREQMVSLHNSRFIPYRYLTNCQYFFSQNSITPDIRNYRFGALSTIAVTPNLCLAEIRPWLDRLSERDHKEVVGFYSHWTAFLKKNYALWKRTYQVGDDPGTGSVEVYGHTDGAHGYVFIVNPNYWSRTVAVPLDGRLGFSGNTKCEVRELYPIQRLRLTQDGPFTKLGSTLAVEAEPQQVIVLEIGPAPTEIREPRLYGLPGKIERKDGGYLIRTSGRQGSTERFAVVLPEGAKRFDSISVRPDVPKQPERQFYSTDAKLLAGDETTVTGEVTFRREVVPTEIRRWKVRPGDLQQGISSGWDKGLGEAETLDFPLFEGIKEITPPAWDHVADSTELGPLSDFCCAYIENAIGEEQETWIELGTGGKDKLTSEKPKPAEQLSSGSSLHPLAGEKSGGWWLEASFDLPFMYTIGAEPFFDEHTFVVFPFIRQNRVKQIKAWVNGVPLDVQNYRYPRNRGLGCFYADLVGTGAHSGRNTLVVQFEAQ